MRVGKTSGGSGIHPNGGEKVGVALLTALALIVSACAGGPSQASPSAATARAAATSAATAAPTPVTLQKIRLGVPVAVLPLASGFIAKSKGYFAEEGLDAEITLASGTLCLTGVVSEQFAMCTGGSYGLMVAAEQGQPTLAIANLVPTVALYLILRNDVAKRLNITDTSAQKDKLAALKGLTIAVTGVGDAANQSLDMMIKEAGLQAKDVKIVPITSQAGQLAALLEKQIDGIVGGPPLSDQLDVGGVGTILVRSESIPAMSQMMYEVLYTTPKWADAHPELAKAAVRAIVKANNYLRSDPEAPKQMNATDWKSISTEVLTLSLNRMKSSFSPDVCFTEAQATGLMKFAVSLGILSKPIDAAQGTFWTNKYNSGCK